MRYQIRHLTRYDYSGQATLSHNEARVLPRNLPWQKCLNSEWQISPKPVRLRERSDFFGNRVAYFSTESVHDSLEVVVVSEVDVSARPAQDIFSTITWPDAVSDVAQSHRTGNRECIDARLYVLESPFVRQQQTLQQYAEECFEDTSDLIQGLHILNKRIFDEFTYDPGVTTTATPVHEVMAAKRGVCQDFAHLMIGCLRSLGLPARYVSGYMETLPPPGQEKLLGADATHAWIAAFIPGWGWLELDPTNGCLPDERYIVLGWGRDYADVTPLKGVMTGGGEHELSVAVDVIPKEVEQTTAVALDFGK
ncbi:transglutaminase family protein [Pseudohongiella sp. SYSU M77423]|uniref:transglutaminase family protein n=1 Tax=unclassified Pseudohongiella TaxID=2629611 RepID=UPI001F296216|nr:MULTISPECIES: transglutaminase family protein [unclassified Pseudohongiella]MDH7944356.1 transglutaminase family protein [Pseudohongiella sp. SYSU M77423]MEC8860763.1 transglutaminase family protein [Pseudomonadota bacterium]